jgi:N,N-dimethylformamidase
MAQQKIFGYANRISVRPGDEISFHVNCDGAGEADAQLVRLIHGDTHEEGPGHVEVEVESPVNGRWAVKKQFTQLGSFLKVIDPENKLAVSGSFSLAAFIWPTLPQRGSRQTILGRWDTLRNTGYALGINPAGYLEFWVGNGTEVDYVTAELPLLAKVWYLIGVSYNRETGRTELYQEGVLNRYNSLVGKVVPYDFASHVAQHFRFKPQNNADVPFLLGGARDEHAARGPFVNDLYSGKIDRPAICERALTRAEFDVCRQDGTLPPDGLLAFWDTSKGYSAHGVGHEVIDTGPHRLNARGVNHPVRAMTGWNWNGKDDCFRIDPSQFGGIEFHPDAVTDCGWEATKSMIVPTNLKSGIYAMRLRIGPGIGIAEEYIVFVVRPPKPTAKLCFLVPSASYLAYGNETLSFDAQIIQPMTGQPPVVTDLDVETYEHREYGLSTYDHYEDDAGVCFSSYLRPIINMRPKYRMSSMNITWQFPADLSIVAWLDHMGYDCDFITDEDLHREGV